MIDRDWPGALGRALGEVGWYLAGARYPGAAILARRASRVFVLTGRWSGA